VFWQPAREGVFLREVEAVEENENSSLGERVEHLEKVTGELRVELRHTLQRVDRVLAEEGASAPESGLPRTRSATTPPLFPETAANDRHRTGERAAAASDDSSRSARSFEVPLDLSNLGNLRSGEWWLNKLGIGLLLFGVAFLFMFSVEKGWITPPLRVAFGLAVGTTLLVMGLHVYENRRSFSQVLLGGGVGALYITGFAAFQLYSLVPYTLAFAFMVAVTLLAYVFSLRQDGAPLSIIGALGGLGTPLLLYDDAGTLGGLVLYTCLILAGMGAVYFYKGWVSLLAVSSTGGWLVLLIGYAGSLSAWPESSSGDRWTLQLGVAFTWLLLWLVPVVRRALRGSGPDTGRGPVHPHLYVVSTPIVALAFTGAIWTLSSSDFGWITLSGAALYTLAALALRHLGSSHLSYTHALVALLLLTQTFVLMLEGGVLFLTLAVEAAILHFVARRFSDRVLSAGAHLLSFAVAVWLANRLFPGARHFLGTGHPVLFVRAFVDLVVIALAFGASTFVLPRNLGLVYRTAAHAAFLAFLWREFSMLPGGEGWVTVAWGLYAVGLLVVGLRLDRAALVRGGMATLFLVAGKLFLVDLAEVEALWRVLLFLGFGGLFLALSYYLHSLWRPGSGESSTKLPRRGGGSPVRG